MREQWLLQITISPPLKTSVFYLPNQKVISPNLLNPLISQRESDPHRTVSAAEWPWYFYSLSQEEKHDCFSHLVQIGNSAQYRSELEVKFELICLTPVSDIYYGLVAGQDKKPELQQWQHRCTLRLAEMGDDHFHSSSLCLDLAVP